MVLSVRYFDEVPKGTPFNFHDVIIVEIWIKEFIKFEGDQIPILNVRYTDESGRHQLENVLDVEVM